MNRREFLRLAAATGAAAAVGSVTGCGRAPAVTATPIDTAPPSARVSPSATSLGPPTAAEWATLAASIGGGVVRPGAPAYGHDRQLFNPRFDGLRPTAIAYCQSAGDVQRTVAFARAHDLPIAARSGGHSYAGYSSGTGIVCDVSHMNTVRVAADSSARIGAGARLIDVYSGVAASNRAVAGGSCPTVGFAGLALGGGVGVIGRRYGLACDGLTQVDIVTADGSLVTCDATTNSDLFWGCRGGGGGNFGIVTGFVCATHPAPSLTIFQCSWPWPAAADVMAGWQSWIRTLPDEVWSSCHALNNPSAAQPQISVGGSITGSAAQLQPWLTSLQAAVGSRADLSVGGYSYLDGMLLEAGCYGDSVAACTLAPAGVVQREASLGRSDVVMEPLSPAALAVIIAGVEERQANPDATTIAGVALDAVGGAINRVAADATAFVHRSALCIAQYNATWPTGAPSSVVASNERGVDSLYQAMRPHASGFAYQNYIDPLLADWQNAYYGTNLARLISIKGSWDPTNLFHFAQSIPTA